MHHLSSGCSRTCRLSFLVLHPAVHAPDSRSGKDEAPEAYRLLSGGCRQIS